VSPFAFYLCWIEKITTDQVYNWRFDISQTQQGNAVIVKIFGQYPRPFLEIGD